MLSTKSRFVGLFLCVFATLPFSIFGQITIQPSKAFPVYTPGETASFSITSTTSGAATYQFVYDEYKVAGPETPINLIAGQAATVQFALNTPGGIFCKVKQNGVIARSLALYSPEKIEASRPEPADFDAFWNTQKQALAAVPLNPQVTFSSENASSTTYRINLGHIDNRKVYGWLTIPKGNGSYPAVITFPSFGSGAVYAANYLSDQLGVIAFSLTIHNAEPDQTDPLAYIPNDPSNRNQIYYKYGILAGIRAIDYLHTRADFDGQNLAVFGESQGGGLATMVAGLDQRVDLLITGIDALCEHNAWLDGKASSFPYFLQVASTSTSGQTYINAVAEACKYYDAVYFMRRFKGNTLSAVGHADEICPTPTIITKSNQATNKVITIHSLDNGHKTPIFFWKAHPDFIRAHFPTTISPTNAPWAATTKGYELTVPATLSAATAVASTMQATFINDGATVNAPIVRWEKLSGPGNVVFSSANQLTTQATFDSAGQYVIRIEAQDLTNIGTKTVVTAVDYITVTVSGTGGGNTGGGGGNTGGGTPGVLCASSGSQPWQEWIARVDIGTFQHSSLKEGFADYTSLAISVKESSSEPITLTPGYSFTQFNEFWRVWADWNNDNDFTDAGELVFEKSGVGPQSGSLAIPNGMGGKQIRLRIGMKNGSFPNPCEAFQLGEVQDYRLTVQVNAPPTVCNLTITEGVKLCSQNNTPTIGSDDTWSVNFTMQNATATGTYQANYLGLTQTRNYGESVTVAGIAMNGQNMSILVTDGALNTCTTTFLIVPPAPCAQVAPPPTPCAITYTEVQKVCSTNNTPSQASDDTWTLTFRATNADTTLKTFRVNYLGQSLVRNYGDLVTIARPMNGNSLAITLTDALNTTCTSTVSVIPPAPCVVSVPCDIVYTEVQKVCSVGTTPYNAVDDTWSLTFRSTNADPSLTNYILAYNGLSSNRTYGQNVTITLPMNGNTVVLTLSDALKTGCTKTITVNPPTPCVQIAPPAPGPINYCPVASDYPWEEWISSVRLNNSNTKNSAKEGYADFTSTRMVLKTGNNDLRVTNQFSYQTAPLYTKIWIDIDKNGVFGNLAEELIASRYTTAPAPRVNATSLTTVVFNARSGWFTGTTRMRIIVSKSQITGPCTNIARGEIEDYTVAMEGSNFIQSSDPLPQTDEERLQVYPNPASQYVHINLERFAQQEVHIDLIGQDNRVVLTESFAALSSQYVSLDVSQLVSGLYYIRVTAAGQLPMTEKVIVQNRD